MPLNPLNPYNLDPNDPTTYPLPGGMGGIGLGGYGAPVAQAPLDPGAGAVVVPSMPSAMPPLPLPDGSGGGNPYTARMSQALLAANAPLPTRDARREGRGAVLSGLAGSLLGLLSGNAAIGLGAAGAGMQGYQRGADQRFGQEMQSAVNRQKLAEAQAAQYGRLSTQYDNSALAQKRIDNQTLNSLVNGWPAFLKSLQDNTEGDTPEQRGAKAQAYLSRADALAGGPGKSGIILDYQKTNFLPQTMTATDDGRTAVVDADGNYGIPGADGSYQPIVDKINDAAQNDTRGHMSLAGARPALSAVKTPAQVGDLGAIPILAGKSPKELTTAERLRSANTFLDSLPGLDAKSQQEKIKTADTSGYLSEMGLSIPKDANGNYLLSLAKAAPLKAPVDAEANRLKNLAVNLAADRRLFGSLSTNAAERPVLAKRIADAEKELKIGDGAPLPANLILQMTPAQKAALADHAASRAVTVRGQDKAAATAAMRESGANARATASNAIRTQGLGLQKQALDARLKSMNAGKFRTVADVEKEIAVISKKGPDTVKTITDKDGLDKKQIVHGLSMADTPAGKEYLATLQRKKYELETAGVKGTGVSSLPGVGLGQVSPSASTNARIGPTTGSLGKQGSQTVPHHSATQPRHQSTGQFIPPRHGGSQPKTTRFKSKSGTLTITG